MDDVIDWVRTTAIPLATVEAGGGFGDLEKLRAIIGSARIVSLGEATHGTHEFFQLKHRLLEFCVAELGFNIFGIEANYPESLRVNDYVLHGTGKAAEALRGLYFWTWDTEEVLALIEWMREWNKTHERKVKFYGFDMQYSTEAALCVLDYLHRVEPEFAADCEAPLLPVSSELASSHLKFLPEPVRRQTYAAISGILDAFTNNRSAWILRSSAHEWGLARLCAVVLEQSARSDGLAGEVPDDLRDVAMADNAACLLALEGPDAKAVLWAHNGHVAKEIVHREDDPVGYRPMGYRLNELFGSQHRVVGFAFNRGSFQAIEPGRGLVEHTVSDALKGSMEHVLTAAGHPACLLDLSAAPPAGAVADWFSSRPLGRCIGAVYSERNAQHYLMPIDPGRSYDVLAFLETTTAARDNNTRAQMVRSPLEPPSALANLDFVGEGKLPDGWQQRNRDHQIVISDAQSPAGGRIVVIKRETSPWRWRGCEVKKLIAAGDWRGKRCIFSAAIRADVHELGAGAQLYIQLMEKPPEDKVVWWLSSSAMVILDRPVRSAHWDRYKVELFVPGDTYAITVGLAMTGNGEAWFGDLELEAGLLPATTIIGQEL